MRKFLIVLTFGLSLFSCKNTNQSHQPEKPNSIPPEAFWRGGIDGGQWYTIDAVNGTLNTAVFTIYDESGEEVVNKEFKLHCDDTGNSFWKDLKNVISGFDGKRIHLSIENQGHTKCYFE